MEVLRFRACARAPGRGRVAGSARRRAAGREWSHGPAVGAAGCRGGVIAQPAAADAAWYRLDAVLDATGTLSGQRLTSGIVGGARAADRPAARGVRVGTGARRGPRRRRRRHAVATARDRSGAWLLDDDRHRGVGGAERDVRARPRLDGRASGGPGDARRTWASGAGPPAAGRRCACCPGSRPTSRTGGRSRRTCGGRPMGASRSHPAASWRCRTRLVDPAAGSVQSTERTGPVLGVADAKVIAYDVCPGFPCGVLSRRSGLGRVRAAGRGRRARPGSAASRWCTRTTGTWPGATSGRGLTADVAASDLLEPVGDGSTARAGVDPGRPSVLLATVGRPLDPSTLRRFDPASAAIEPVWRCGHEAASSPRSPGRSARGRPAGRDVVRGDHRRARPRSDPRRRAVRAERKSQVPLGGRAAGGHEGRHQGRRRGRERLAPLQGADVRLRRGRRQRRLPTAATCRAGSTASPACAATHPAGSASGSGENGHRFDWGTLRWCELSGGPDGCYQVRNVMLDELGHVLVLDHHDNFGDDRDYDDAVVQTFSRTKPRSGWNAHEFGRCDVATLQQQYDVAERNVPVQHLPRRAHGAVDRGIEDGGDRRVDGDVHRDARIRRQREAVEQRAELPDRRPPAAASPRAGATSRP